MSDAFHDGDRLLTLSIFATILGKLDIYQCEPNVYWSKWLSLQSLVVLMWWAQMEKSV